MKVLFVVSGNSKNNTIAPFIKSQGDSLQHKSIEVEYFTIIGKGIIGYLKNVLKLRSYLKKRSVDIIHAHYSLSGGVAVLATPKAPIILSLMGDDAVGTFKSRHQVSLKSRILLCITWLFQPFFRAIIYKSPNLEKAIYRKRVSFLIPNGVRLKQFKLYEGGCREELGLEKNKKYVLFLGNPADPCKNYALAKEAMMCLNQPDVELIAPYPIPHDKVVKYLNSVDAFVLSSFMEGSPNVVKEAMACNCPMVVTDVGDAAWVVGDTTGCYVSSHNPQEYAEKLAQALEYAAKYGRTKGRERIITLGLDAQSVADKIITVYKKVLKKKVEYYYNLIWKAFFFEAEAISDSFILYDNLICFI